MRPLVLTLSYYLPLIALSSTFYVMAKLEQAQSTTYIMGGALAILWVFASAHAWERSIIHRRLWVNQIFHPESSAYRLLKGGALLLLTNVLRSLPLALFLLLHLLQLELYEWAVVYLALTLKIILYHWAKARFKRVFVSGLNSYIARVSTDYVIIGASYVILIYGFLNLVPHPNLAGLSVSQVMESANQSAAYAQGSVFYHMIYYANLCDSMYLWGVQNMGDVSIQDVIMRRGLIVLFAIQHFVFVLMIQKFFNGVIMMVNVKRHLAPISQLDQTQDNA